MVQAQTPTETVTYKYDDDNIRVSETVGGTTKSYVLDKNRPYAQVLAEYEGDTEVASYTYGLDLIEQERDGNESYYSVDGLGSTRVLTDENGTVTDTYTYDAYGEGVSEVGNTENDYRFAGEQFDGTLGQYYLRQRYYDPNSGRFTRRDTYEGRANEPITLHKYLYANANPVNGIDPSGLVTFGLSSHALIAQLLVDLTAIGIGIYGLKRKRGEPLPPLGGFGDGPKLSVPSHTGHKPNKSLLSKLLSLPGFNEGPKLDPGPSHTGHNITWDDFIRYVFSAEIKLTRGGRRKIGNLIGFKDTPAAEAIRARGGGASQVNQLGQDYKQVTVGEIANLAAQKDDKAETALKIIKQAGKKNQKYGGK
ncbi:RHS repeat-associated core domain-containing protein [Lusitaniella coriacea LEGE 07157]|uniref:RHS repeat-associated core domain-containing protein n=1 Tax=Lusitaniella coriacea LEGE 07157 TaxID=945747 RepID=A0A8J7JFQ6_9CYAN|nr:RHS repeat-associated core domain-containing protein [Lusitaniella coriacea]MBE9118935.1 RHS repeat-associated core domain-containing protein [Lusitaniella coriacea LEGE 07157]